MRAFVRRFPRGAAGGLVLGLALAACARRPASPRATPREPEPLPFAARAAKVAEAAGVSAREAGPGLPSSVLFTPLPGAAPAEPLPGVVLLHGSGAEGGELTFYPAARLAAAGFAALALSYAGAPGTPPVLADVELERVAEAARWLGQTPEVTGPAGAPRWVGLLGWSRGAELALLVASETDAPVAAVSAHAPIAETWPSWDPGAERVVADGDGGVRAAWRLDGTPLATGRPIRLERFAGAVELVAGADDAVWPSAEAVRTLAARRAGKGGETNAIVLAGEGHFFRAAFRPSLERTAAFLRRHLAAR